jgi:transcriptional regulator with XRE-family HTH domain
MANFPQRLNEAIGFRGVSQKWLATKSHTTEATISRYLNGKASPAVIEILRDISLALNVSSDYLIGTTNMIQSKESVSEEERIVLSVWSKITADDKKVLFALLDKYLSPDDKLNLYNSKSN